ncbi:MAG: cytochrome c biogenesis protein ResB [candidate division WOR-3 bacterium]
MSQSSLPKRTQGAGRLALACYRLLASRTVTVILLLGFAGLVCFGRIASQSAGTGLGSGLNWFVAKLRLDDLFHARLLLFPTGALVGNLLLCALGRLRPRMPRPDELAGSIHFRQFATSIPVTDSWTLVEAELLAQGFRVRRRTEFGNILWTAESNPLGRLGSIVFHLALLVAVAGFVSRRDQVSEGVMTMFPDQGSDIILPTDDTLRVQLSGCWADYNLAPGRSNYTPRQVSSHLVLYRNHRFERDVLLQINRPASVRGTTLFQGEPAQIFVLRLRAADSSGRTRRDTVVRVRENQEFSLFASQAPRYHIGLVPLGDLYFRDSLLGSLPALAVLTRTVQTGDHDLSQFDTLRIGADTKIGDVRVNLLNIRQGASIIYRHDPARPWLEVAGALFLAGLFLRGIVPAYELSGSITEEEGETVVRLGGRALGLFTSLRPLLRRIAQLFELE